jgi:hypothetical protein
VRRWAPRIADCLGCSFQPNSLTAGGADAGPRDGASAADAALSVDARVVDARLFDAAIDARVDAAVVVPDAPVVVPDAPVVVPDAPVVVPDAPVVVPDAPPDAPPPPPDAAQPDAPDRTGVVCGLRTCRDPEGVCCRDEDGPMPFRCESDIDCPSNGTAFECDGPEDCNGFACCFTIGEGSRCTFLGTVCDAEELCHGDDDCSGGAVCCADDPYPACRDAC